MHCALQKPCAHSVRVSAAHACEQEARRCVALIGPSRSTVVARTSSWSSRRCMRPGRGAPSPQTARRLHPQSTVPGFWQGGGPADGLFWRHTLTHDASGTPAQAQAELKRTRLAHSSTAQVAPRSWRRGLATYALRATKSQRQRMCPAQERAARERVWRGSGAGSASRFCFPPAFPSVVAGSALAYRPRPTLKRPRERRACACACPFGFRRGALTCAGRRASRWA